MSSSQESSLKSNEIIVRSRDWEKQKMKLSPLDMKDCYGHELIAALITCVRSVQD